jgi:phosphoribosylformylglycinamidine synthase
LLKMMSTPNLCSRRWIWEQYDHMVMADTIQRPGGDAAVVRVHGTEKALAITTDCTPRYCAADPFEGGRQTVAEAWRNLISVGARPLAVTDNLNFGNPERPEVMGQFVGCIEGMAEACEYLDFPVVSGNVSLYNETNGSAILPTPAIGGVGLIENVENMASIVLPSDNHLFVVGRTEGHIGASIWLHEIEGIEAGNPPPVVLEIERKNGEFIHQCIKDDVITACHDISDGGLLVALAEMALAGRCGADITVEPDGIPLSHYCFGEDQGRYLVATRDKIIITEMAKKCGIELTYLGKSGGNTLTVNKRASISLSSLRDAHESWFPEYMAG